MGNVNYLGTNYEVVEVTFDVNDYYKDRNTETTYSFKTDLKINKGDLLVVESSNGYGLCKALSDSIEKSLKPEAVRLFNKSKAWVIDKVDMTSHLLRKEATERRKLILTQLEERKEAMEERIMFEMLAQKDPTAKKLLEELNNIDNLDNI